MKLSLNNQNKNTIKNIMVGSQISCGYTSYEGKRINYYQSAIKDFYLGEKQGNKMFIVELENSVTLSFRELLVRLGDKYKTKNSRLTKLAKEYRECSKNNSEEKFKEYLEKVEDKEFKIDDTSILPEEIIWLRKHVTSIYAVFPQKYEKAFIRNFPDATYNLNNKSWTYSFRMHFDEVVDMPESLKSLKNSEGNTLDLQKKVMYNTSYIWNLVKDYPNEFSFKRC